MQDGTIASTYFCLFVNLPHYYSFVCLRRHSLHYSIVPIVLRSEVCVAAIFTHPPLGEPIHDYSINSFELTYGINIVLKEAFARQDRITLSCVQQQSHENICKYIIRSISLYINSTSELYDTATTRTTGLERGTKQTNKQNARKVQHDRMYLYACTLETRGYSLLPPTQRLLAYYAF